MVISRFRRKRDRKIERKYAAQNGYYWLPCPLCGEHFGGHEHLALTYLENFGDLSLYVESEDTPGNGQAICPSCVVAGKGDQKFLVVHLTGEAGRV